MDSGENKIDNSIESTMNMTQDEIERLLAAQESQSSDEQKDFSDTDLESLLSNLGEESDRDIQEISNLLNRADNNEAVADDVLSLIQRQEANGETAYDAMDLFSEEQSEKKEGFLKRLLKKFKRKKKEEKNEEVKEEAVSEKNNAEVVEETITQSNMLEALAMLGDSIKEDTNADTVKHSEEEKSAKNKKKKEKKNKKAQKEKNPQKEKKPKNSEDAAEKETDKLPEKSTKKKKEKKIKEKKVKEKPPQNEPIREKMPVEDAIAVLEEEAQEWPHKKKIIMVFVAAVMIMLGFLVVSHYFTRHTNKKLAENAYAESDYLECYQLLYGQKLNDSQAVMFHRSELVLKMDIFWNHYQEFISGKQFLEGLDKLVQFVYDYPNLHDYATEWNCQDTVADTYIRVLTILSEEYQVSEQEAIAIAELEDDIDYTRALHKLVEEKYKKDALNQAYPDILPEEEKKITKK